MILQTIRDFLLLHCGYSTFYWINIPNIWNIISIDLRLFFSTNMSTYGISVILTGQLCVIITTTALMVIKTIIHKFLLF